MEIISVMTKKDNSSNSDYAPIDKYCVHNKIDYCYYQDQQQLIDWGKIHQPDIVFCFGWSHLLPEEFLSIPKLYTIGFHPTLLPKNRGRHPLIWTIILGLESSGISFFEIDSDVDSGNILKQGNFEVSPLENATTLYEKILKVSGPLLLELIYEIENDLVESISQKEKGNVWRKRVEEDGKIDFRMTSLMIDRLVRALSVPYPGAHFSYRDKKYKVWRAEIISMNMDYHYEPGKVLCKNQKGIVVKTADGAIQLELDSKYLRDFEEGVYL